MKPKIKDFLSKFPLKEQPLLLLLKNKKEFLVLIGILFLAFFFRFYQLESIPPGIYPDEAINGNQAITEPGKIFYPENNGREGLFINLISLSFKVFGKSIWSLKFMPALFGALTVLTLYLLAKELFKSEKIALLAGFFLSTAFWQINFSRIAFRAILVPFLLTFSFYFLFKGFNLFSCRGGRKAARRQEKQKEILCFIIAGVLFGLGFYTYISFRFAVLIIPIILIYRWFIFKQKHLTKKFILYTSYFILSTFIIALPIGLYFLQNPSDFLARGGDVSVFGQGNVLKALVESLIKHFAMFNFYGDGNWRHNIAFSPILFWPVGILFLVGFFYSLAKSIISIKKKDFSCLLVYCFLLSWWFIMLLPGILTHEAVPHSLRTIGSLPPVFIFSGLGANLLFEKIKKETSKRFKLKPKSFGFYLIISSLVLLIFSFVLAQYSRYFELWAGKKETADAFSKNYVQIGNYLNSLPSETSKYVIVNQSGALVDGVPMPAQTSIFIERTKFEKPRAVYLLPEDLGRIKPGRETAIIPLQYDRGLYLNLIEIFPEGRIINDQGIWVYKLN